MFGKEGSDKVKNPEIPTLCLSSKEFAKEMLVFLIEILHFNFNTHENEELLKNGRYEKFYSNKFKT